MKEKYYFTVKYNITIEHLFNAIKFQFERNIILTLLYISKGSLSRLYDYVWFFFNVAKCPHYR